MAKTRITPRSPRHTSPNEVASLLLALAAVITAVATLLAVIHA